MKRLYRIWTLIPVMLLSAVSSAQVIPGGTPVSNLRQKRLATAPDSLRVDTLSLIPGEFSIPGVPDSDYRLDAARALLFWINRPRKDSVTATYRVFPFLLTRIVNRMEYDSLRTRYYVKPFEFRSALSETQRGAFDFGTLRAEGSFGRQIGFGNSQNAVLNSTFNLQLSGLLGDSIELQAAITDNNVPIQPDGNTQQLNEFDQVYLQFRKKGWQLSLGDIDLRQNKGHYMNFYKRLQGIAFQNDRSFGKNMRSQTLVSGSVAKGKFTRNILAPLEGNQGPYRLQGANNEFFFIVLANTERVFYDGQLLQRGEDQDYVINYNTAEITFTPRRMITKDSRIQVEFEYADRNYLNANLYLSQQLDVGERFTLRLGAFQNSDARNSSINQVLDVRQKQFLADLGDSIQRAYYPSATIDTLTAGKVLYEKVFLGTDSFYRYSTDPALARYNLAFTDLGQGKGDYVPDFNGANGKVFRYVPPVGAVRQGRYEPVLVLVAPRSQQVIDLGMEYRLGSKTQLKAEAATSNFDVNTFSPKDRGDDRGWAIRVQLNDERELVREKGLRLLTALDYENVQRKFRPIERLRTVEFSRDWGLELLPVPVAVNETIVRATATLRDARGHSTAYQFTQYKRSDRYSGWQQSLRHAFSWRGWVWNNQFLVTRFDGSDRKGTFLRPVIDLMKEFRSLRDWKFGLNYSLEKNDTRLKTADSLLPAAFWFDVWSAYLQSGPAGKNRYRLTFFSRADKYPVGSGFRRGDRSLNLNLQTDLIADPRRQLFLNATFRKLMVHDTIVSKQKADETILGRAEYQMNEWKGLLSGNILYEVGAGQEQRRDFAYLEVPPGTGQYTWIDYNGDGAQQLNEFEIAAFPDQARFIRIFTPTNDFIKANYITFNYSITITPRVLIGTSTEKGFRSLLARFILSSSMQTSRKAVASGRFAFDPFGYSFKDTGLIVLNSVFLNTLSFNRFNSKWGVDLANLRTSGQTLLTYGYESRKLSDWTLKARWNLSRAISLNLTMKRGSNALYTPRFANRNFELSINSAEPLITFIRGTKFRVVTSYRYDRKMNRPVYGGERSVSHALQLESRYNLLQNSSVTGKFTLNAIQYKYPANTAVSYIMLDGLLPGKNFLWSIQFSKRLLNNLELSFQYDGRQAGSSRTVHLGRAGITALF